MIRTQLYADMVFLIKEMGLMVVEIKRSVKQKISRFKQWEGVSHFASLVFDGYTQNKYSLFVLKVLIVEELKIGNGFHD